jgi:hypothetical protein
MNESSSAPAPVAAVLGGSSAVRLGLLLLAGLAVMLGLAAFDKQRRAKIESMAEVTAVGDKVFVKLPAPAVVATTDGRTFEIVSVERQDPRDTRMRQIGKDAATGLTIYQYLGALAKDGTVTAPPPDSTFYLKAGVNEYVPLRERAK